MKKGKNKTKPKQPIDRNEINELIEYVDKFKSVEDFDKFKKIKTYLAMIVKLSMDVEHSKISIAKLQKLFGFITERENSKEVLGIQNLAQMK